MKKHKLNFEWGDRGYHTPFGERDKPYAPCVPICEGKYRGHIPINIRGRSQSSVTSTIETKRGGWFRGVTRLNAKDVLVGGWVRSRDEAWEFARDGAALIRDGLYA